jgi:hypothetical protein
MNIQPAAGSKSMALRIHNRNDKDDHDEEELRQSDSCEPRMILSRGPTY